MAETAPHPIALPLRPRRSSSVTKRDIKRQQIDYHDYIIPGLRYVFLDESFGNYVHYHYLEQSFCVDDFTEGLRYGPVVEMLQQNEQRYEENEQILFQIRQNLVVMNRGNTLPSDGMVGEIVGGALVAECSRAIRKLDQEQGCHREKLATRSTYGALHTFKTLNMSDPVEEPAILRIRTTMKNTFYYGGYQSGDYVMRYRMPNTSTMEEDPVHDRHARPVWLEESQVFRTLATLDDERPLNAKPNFEYCGQVPRPLQEYLYRMEVVVEDIFVIIGSVLAYYLANKTNKMHPTIRELLCVPNVSQQGIGELYQLWQQTFEHQPDDFPETLSADIRKCARVHEFAYLFGTLCNHNLDAIVDVFRPLVRILEQATGWHLYDMMDLEDAKRSKLAEYFLFEIKDFEHIFVFEDEVVESIHELYSDDKYNCDRNHPQQKYRGHSTAAQVNRALELANELSQEPDESQSPGEIVVAANHEAASIPTPPTDEAIDSSDDSLPDDPRDQDYRPLL